VIRAHVAALAAFLGAQGVKVYVATAGINVDGSRDASPTLPYAILSFAAPVLDSDYAVGTRERAEFDVTVGYHAADYRQGFYVAERVMALAGARLSVAGHVATVESAGFATPLRLDDDNPLAPVYSGASGFTITSTPA
jgi:hypothetical protein